MNQLNTDCVARIFDFLSVFDILQLYLVNKDFRDLVSVYTNRKSKCTLHFVESGVFINNFYVSEEFLKRYIKTFFKLFETLTTVTGSCPLSLRRPSLFRQLLFLINRQHLNRLNLSGGLACDFLTFWGCPQYSSLSQSLKYLRANLDNNLSLRTLRPLEHLFALQEIEISGDKWWVESYREAETFCNFLMQTRPALRLINITVCVGPELTFLR